MKIKNIILAILVTGFSSCSLDEDLREGLTGEQNAAIQKVDALILGAYQSLNLPLQDQAQFWAAQEHTGDQVIGPTRAGDWDDAGIWRTLHDHTWSAEHDFLAQTFENILKTEFAVTQALAPQYRGRMSNEQIAEMRFLRAFVRFLVADGWGQVPYREAGGRLIDLPSVFSATETLDFVISELEEILSDLPDGPATKANKNAARVLLMKAYMSKGVFANRAAPTFAAGDMNKVIEYADAVSGRSLEDNYFDNFAVKNEASTENIFTLYMKGGESSFPSGGNSVRSRWFCTLHYNQVPSGWNGFTTLGAFYDSFEEDDVCKYDTTSNIDETFGFNHGFLIGQQYKIKDGDSVKLEDRKGNALAFTKEVALTETGSNLEVTGIRVMKYFPDANNGDHVENDMVIYRYADVLLMKAEAILRGGTSSQTALELVNQVRARSNAPALTSIDLDKLLAERGRELYWEGHRRSDLIRFGKFGGAWHEKPASGSERLLFPIPAAQVALNPNLQQNPGY